MNSEVWLSGLGGAILVFMVGMPREWWRNRRERGALYRLLAAEIEHNTGVCSDIEENPNWISSPALALLTTETWTSVRDRAAQLFPKEKFHSTLFYYMTLQTLLSAAKIDEQADQHPDRSAYEEEWREMLVSQAKAYKCLGGDSLLHAED